MSNVVEFDHDAARSANQRRNRLIGKWLTRLSSYVVHSNEFKAQDQRERAVFWAELVEVMSGAGLPDEIWNADAIRFCRRKFKFFPSAAELCAALSEYAEPIRAAQREQWEAEKRRAALPAYNGLTKMESTWLSTFRKLAADDFRGYADERGTNVSEARHSAITLLRRMAPAAYELLSDCEKRDAWRIGA